MKVKHTKLKKSIFLILICISLTTTFVVSASAVETDSTVTLNYPGGSLNFPFQYYLYGYNQIVQLIYVPDYFELDGVSLDADNTLLNISYGESLDHNIESYSSFPLIFPGFVDSYSLSVPSNGIDSSFVSIVYDELYPGVFLSTFLIPFSSSSDYTITFHSSSSPSFTDSVGSGLTSSLSWVGQVFESLTTGPIRPLLECFAVTISVSAVLLGIYSIRRFIWGS